MSLKPRTITLDMAYPWTDSISDSFRVHLKSDANGGWLPTILVVSRGDLNPLDYFQETYEGLSRLLEEKGLSLSKCAVYVDLLEYVGIRSGHLFRWHLNNENGYKLIPVDLENLESGDAEVVKSFYRDRWSLFIDSLLTNEEKAEFIAIAMSNTIYDEYSAEGVQLSIRHKLLEYIRNRKNIGWM